MTALVTALLLAGLVGLDVVTEDRAEPVAKLEATTTTIEQAAPEVTASPLPAESVAPANTRQAPHPTTPPQFVVSGRVVDAANRPAAGVPVVLAPDSGLIDFFILIFAAFSAGVGLIACTLPDVCGKGAAQGVTDGAGRFEFRVGAEAANKRVVLTVQRNEQPSSARSSRKYTLTGSHQDLGTTPLWEPQLSFGNKGATWRPAAPNGANGTLELRDAGEGRFDMEGAGTGVRYDSRLLEDLRLSGRVRANKDGVNLYSQELPVQGPGTPLSRSRPCVVSDPHPPVQRNDCPWTSGRLAPGAHLEQGARGKTLDIDLGSERSVGYLVLRGNNDLGSVEVSSDRSNWRPISARPDFEADQHLGATLPPGTRTRWMRIRFDGFDTTFLDQAGIWP